MKTIGPIIPNMGITTLPADKKIGDSPLGTALVPGSENKGNVPNPSLIQETSARLPDASAIVRLQRPAKESFVGTEAVSVAHQDQSKIINFNKLLLLDGYQPEIDSELHLLLNEAQHVITADDLEKFINKVKKFNKGPVILSESYPGQFLINLGAGRKMYWYDLRDCLKLLPKYFALTKILELPYIDSVDLLNSVIDTVQNDFVGIGRQVMPQLMGILEALIDDGQEMGKNLSAFYEFLKVAQNHGEICRALGIIKCSVNAGIPFHRALELVVYIYENAAIEGYAFMALYDEINSLRVNDIDGEALFQALMHVSGDDPYYNQNYKGLTQLLYVAATQTPHSQQDVIDKINSVAAKKLHSAQKQKALATTNDNELDPLTTAAKTLLPVTGDQSNSIAKTQKEPEIYFPQTATGKLVHGILPYRLSKNYRDGLTDLRVLMENEFPEGAWVYDPQDQTWFSMGGKTSVGTGRIRTEFFPYDLSQLSRRPVFVHIHPETAETFVAPNVDSLAVPQFQKKITKFFASMPSVADFELFATLLAESTERDTPLEAIIVTSIGMTEIQFPNDPEKIRQFAKTFLAMKDTTLFEFDAFGYYHKHGIRGKDITFVRTLTKQLNAKLPDGFKIIIHDFDEYISTTKLQ